MKNENGLKTPQLLTRSKKRTDDEASIQVKESEEPNSICIQNFSHRDAFGWVFPKIEDFAKKKNVIDLNWLNDYNDEIDKLQIVIKKERSLSFNSQCGDLLERRPSRNVGSELEESLDSTHSYEIELPNLAERPSIRKDLVKSDSLLLSVNNNNNNEDFLSSTPSADAFCSIRSCPSRDSGISASDEISDPLPEINIDRSLLAELEGICEDEQPDSTVTIGALSDGKDKVSVEQCCEALSESGDLTDGLIGNTLQKCPVWYKKFSIGKNDLILNFDSLNWGLGPECDEEISGIALEKDEQYDSLLSRSDKDSSGVGDSVEEVETIDTRRRQRIKDLWSICDRLEASSLRGGKSLKGLSEVMELVASFSKIDSRLEILKCDLQSLSRQTTESRHEFNSLHKRASNLLTSTVSSRHHMAQLFCLERLEERLQEEWWGAHYPDLVKLNESYVV